MRSLILYAALLSAVAGYKSTSYLTPQSKVSTSLHPEVTTLRLDMSSTATEEPSSSSSSSTAATSSQTNLVEEVVSELPVSLPPILEEVDLPNLPNRRVITYDQRQEGQYNIRADLDNFMIVLIPPGPSEGLGLLDLLTRSSLRRTSHTSKGKKKLYSTSTALKPDAFKNLNYVRSNDHQYSGSSKAGEFIDGRTPYHVDIVSLNEDEVQPRLNPDRQVDVLPPSYPLAYQHLMKPYHLEAESTLLPPSENSAQNTAAESTPSQNSGFYRFARYIRGENFLDSNRATSSNRLGPQPSTFRRQQLPVYRSDLSMGAAQLYPPLDVPHFTYHSARNFGSKSASSALSLVDEVDSKQTLDSELGYSEIIIPPAHLPLEDDLDLAFSDDSLLEGEAKALLSDGIERCAPGKRRDSYGVCREIEGY